MLDDTTYSRKFAAQFVDELRLTLDGLESLTGNLRRGDRDHGEVMEELREECARLKQMAYWSHERLIALTFRRLGDYVDNLDQPSEYQVDDINAFFDVMVGILEGEIDKDSDEAEFVRSLPARLPPDIEDVDHLDIEVLVVDQDGQTLLILEQELRNCGYRVSGAGGFFDGLELAVRTRPDFIVSAADLGELSGADLARSIRAISVTRTIPFIVLTGFTVDQSALRELPEGTAMVRRGEGFGEDLASALQKFQII